MIDPDVLMKTASLSKTTIATSSNRFLRLLDTEVQDTVRGDNDVDREDRGNTPSISKVDDLIHKVFKSNPEKAQIEAWMKSRVHPQALFATLRPGKSTTKLDNDPDLLLWFKLVAAFRAKKGNKAFSDLDLYHLLLKKNSAEELNILFESFLKTGGLKDLGKSMQKSLSGSWMSKAIKHETSPTIVYDTLRLREAGTKLGDSPIFHQWLSYVQKYRAQERNHWFGDREMLDLFRKTMPEDDVVTLLHLLQNVPGMKNHGDAMQRLMFLSSKTSRKTMSDVWLKYDVSPEEVWKILRLAETNMDALNINAMFHSVVQDVPDLKLFAENMQTNLFQKCLQLEWDPKAVSSMLAIPYPTSALHLPKSDPIYKTWEAYTLYFSERKGGVLLLNKVKTLLDNDNPIGALTQL
ncbi:RXLR phytopathogen effector protein WY-domain [Phytophthora infestans]|uniref:RXLR phytopathogen effector protein WY-domain n=1 Tax=Phytophthora infestans TaxID=4787 RepID=A0A8S9UJI3_PHYIN|nr:RXLR phytopathogen effector protein WY-domain [Phytophthora infestans]